MKKDNNTHGEKVLNPSSLNVNKLSSVNCKEYIINLEQQVKYASSVFVIIQELEQKKALLTEKNIKSKDEYQTILNKEAEYESTIEDFKRKNQLCKKNEKILIIKEEELSKKETEEKEMLNKLEAMSDYKELKWLIKKCKMYNHIVI